MLLEFNILMLPEIEKVLELEIPSFCTCYLNLS